MSCVVSFAPGSSGHFVGSVCQYILHGTKFEIDQNGSCHHSHVKFWGGDQLILEPSAEGLIHEMATIKRLPVPNTRVAVTHARNLYMLSEIFSKVIYISFTEQDVSEMVNKFQRKNQLSHVSESNYNNIKGMDWPPYEIYLNGQAPDFVLDELNLATYKTSYEHWCWVMPALATQRNIHEIPFQNITKCCDWIPSLCEFLSKPLTDSQLEYCNHQWQLYSNKQI